MGEGRSRLSGLSGRVTDLLPHEGPAVLLERVVEYSEGKITCIARFHGDSPYVVAGKALGPALLEVMAQAAAALGSLERLETEQPRVAPCGVLKDQATERSSSQASPPRAGYLVSVSQALFSVEQVTADVELSVDVARVDVSRRASSFEGRVTLGSGVLAQGTFIVHEEGAAESLTGEPATTVVSAERRQREAADDRGFA